MVTASSDPRPSGPGLPHDVTGLLRRLMADDPGRPRLTWYGPDGERVEFSAKVLDNWVAKTANLLVDELDTGPGSRVAIALPTHWRTVCWLLATWAAGACAVVVAPGAAPPADAGVLVAAEPAMLAGLAATATLGVGVALPALAVSFGPGLPEGALDAASGVRSHGDVFVPFVHPVPADPALETPALRLPHGELLAEAARAAERAGWPPRVRLLTGAAPEHLLSEVVGPLTLDGSVVLHHDLASLSHDALASLTRQEALTARA